jgi:hypothetical protein
MLSAEFVFLIRLIECRSDEVMVRSNEYKHQTSVCVYEIKAFDDGSTCVDVNVFCEDQMRDICPKSLLSFIMRFFLTLISIYFLPLI